ncbi:hypothetical protein B0T17DRAFT_612489 [Bombardia bombarda]|uniref:RING-type domain-containing protein n=1 Tax=Bombardia bombarda TaxID=252184 RepID=A0AA40CEU9_9PEZI|nr:hypothetical protein B0T17DRAFT_612489 [Bombardia bombarda]
MSKSTSASLLFQAPTSHWPLVRFLNLFASPFISARGFVVIAQVVTAAAAAAAATMSISMRRRGRSYGIKKEIAVLEKPSSKAQIQVDATCSICQEPIGSKSPEGITESWSMLPCGHRFGSYCIKRYLLVVADDRPSCPICRQIAYYACGHPVLPALKPELAKIVESSDLLVEQLKYSNCFRWKTAFGWLKTRLGGRDEEDDQGSLGGNASQTADAMGGWAGPRVDPFPRTRDPEWEKWWNKQEPCEP